MSTKQQKSIAIVELGKPVVSFDRPIPQPQAGQVLIKVKAAHLLPHDASMRDRGLFVGKKLPWVLAADVSGTIESFGPGTSSRSLNKGDRVFGLVNLTSDGPDQAGLQEYATLDLDALTRVPDSFTIEDANTVPLNLITVFLALYNDRLGFNLPAPWESRASDHQGETLVIVGAGSNCGKFAISLGKISGIGKIIAVAGGANEKELRGLGATHFIDRHASDIQKQVHAITPRADVVHVLDAYNSTYELAASLLADTKPSRLVSLHYLDPEQVKKLNPQVNGSYMMCTNANLGKHKEKFWEHLPKWLESKEVLPARWKIIGGLDAVDAVNQALDDYKTAKGGPQAIVAP